MTRNTVSVRTNLLLLTLVFISPDSSRGDVVIFAPNDSVEVSTASPTTITFPIQLSVTDGPAGNVARPGDSLGSWDLQTFDIGNFTGTITGVKVIKFENGNAFDGVSSFLLSSTTLPTTLGGSIITPSTPSPVLTNDATLSLVTVEVPAGQTGSFEVFLSGTTGLGDFGIFDANFNPYQNVSLRNGTVQVVTAIPEPSPILLLGLVSTLVTVSRRTCQVRQHSVGR